MQVVTLNKKLAVRQAGFSTPGLTYFFLTNEYVKKRKKHLRGVKQVQLILLGTEQLMSAQSPNSRQYNRSYESSNYCIKQCGGLSTSHPVGQSGMIMYPLIISSTLGHGNRLLMSSKISNLLGGNPAVYPSTNFASRTKQSFCQSMAPNSGSPECHAFPDLMKPIIPSLRWHNFGMLMTESIQLPRQRLPGPEKKIATYRNAQIVAITAEIKSFQVHFITSQQRRLRPMPSVWMARTFQEGRNTRLSFLANLGINIHSVTQGCSPGQCVMWLVRPRGNKLFEHESPLVQYGL